MAKEPKTEELEAALKAADDRLHSIQNQMREANMVRSMIESGKSIEEIQEYVVNLVKMGTIIKNKTYEEIESLHLKLAERHMKLTKNWKFVHIGDKNEKR